MKSEAAPHLYEFGEFQLDVARRVLARNGLAVSLTPKALDLLLALLDRRDGVVAKDELMTILWPDTAVEENNLTVTMSALRKVLGEHPAAHQFIVTIPGRGYRFVAAVKEHGASGSGSSVHSITRSPQGRPGNLPDALSSFVGRDRELADVRRLVKAHRLITLTGSGGCGKSRLATEVGRLSVDEVPDGVWLVELAPISDPMLVPPAVAAVFGLREDSGRPVVESLVDLLRARSPLVVIDNCEHLIDACARLAQALLARVPGLRILATSREPLAIEGEMAWRVPSLAVPAGGDTGRDDDMASYDSVRLFVERASAVSSAFSLSAANASSIAQICRRLDGIPLALELAAARVGVITVDQIAARLDDQFRLLTSGSRTALPRHRTLRASIEWSHALLSRAEQRLFRRLSVFYGGWTLEAAEHVGVSDVDAAGEVLDGLSSLVNKSLVIAEQGTEGQARYRMLETVRQYARERLTDSGEEERVRVNHLRFFLELAERAEPDLYGADSERVLERLTVEHDNVRTACDWALGRDAEASLRLVGAIFRFWVWRGYLREGAERVDMALNRAGTRGTDIARAKALHAAASIAMFRGDLASGAQPARESVAFARRAGAEYLVAYSLLLLAITHLYQEGDQERAEAMLEESLGLARQVGEPFLVALVLINLGFPAILQGKLDRAEALLAEGLSLARGTRNSWIIAAALVNAGLLALAKGEPLEAAALCQESLTRRAQSGDRWGMIQSLEALAQVVAALGDLARAARLLGASATLGKAIGADVPAFVRAAHAQMESQTRAALGEEVFAAAWSDGHQMTLDRVVALACEPQSNR